MNVLCTDGRKEIFWGDVEEIRFLTILRVHFVYTLPKNIVHQLLNID